MLSILEIAASRCAPSVSADGSLKLPSSVFVAPADGAFGVGEVGGFGAGFDAGAGALGGAGVCATFGTGVEGGFADEDAEEDAAGAAFGFASHQPPAPGNCSCYSPSPTYL